VSLDIDAHVDSMRRSGGRAIAGGTRGRIELGQTVTWRALLVPYLWRLIWHRNQHLLAMLDGASR